MSRIECETAAQCEQLAEVMTSFVEPLVAATVVGVVGLSAATVAYTEVRSDE